MVSSSEPVDKNLSFASFGASGALSQRKSISVVEAVGVAISNKISLSINRCRALNTSVLSAELFGVTVAGATSVLAVSMVKSRNTGADTLISVGIEWEWRTSTEVLFDFFSVTRI